MACLYQQDLGYQSSEITAEMILFLYTSYGVSNNLSIKWDCSNFSAHQEMRELIVNTMETRDYRRLTFYINNNHRMTDTAKVKCFTVNLSLTFLCFS